MSDYQLPQTHEVDAKFEEATLALARIGIRFTMPSAWQIKVGRYNYFWTKGTITMDGGGRIEGRGIEAFSAMVTNRVVAKQLNPNSNQVKRTNAAATEVTKQKPETLIDRIPNEPPPWE